MPHLLTQAVLTSAQACYRVSEESRISNDGSFSKLSHHRAPNDANLFGTLGDIYEKSGKQDLAVEAYKKALAIDPNFEKAKAKLKQQP